jgi:hypothetical protein
MKVGSRQIEFVGGPMDGAVGDVIDGCDTMTIEHDGISHAYWLCESGEGKDARPVMRHWEAINPDEEFDEIGP